jgi:hypothetical protein
VAGRRIEMGDVACNFARKTKTVVSGLGGSGDAATIIDCLQLLALDSGQLPLVLAKLFTDDAKMGFNSMTGTACPFQWDDDKDAWKKCPLLKPGGLKP